MPGPGNPYFLTGKLTELDGPGEWFMEGGSATLYFETPAGDNPSQYLVEVKRRQFAFDLRGRSFITITGFNIFAATITSSAGSQYLLLDSLNAQYLSHYSLISSSLAAYFGIPDSGIILSGHNNVLRNSTIAFSAGNGVLIDGDGHKVFNNIIRDTD
jgi:hypothetical protein